MSQIFGEFIQDFSQKHQSLELSFNNPVQLNEKQWRNHRLSACFQADYFANLLAIDEDDTQGKNRIEECKNALSYIGNELLENAMKFNEISSHDPVKLGIYLLKNTDQITAVIFAKNSINCQYFTKFQAFIQELLSVNTQELYVQQIEKIAETEDSEASGLGLLTIINDYSAKLGWKFEPESSNPQIIIVTTMAQIVV